MRYVYYKNTAIPIDEVLYIKYFPRGKQKSWENEDDTNITRVYLQKPNSPYQYSIEFKGNHVKDLMNLVDDGTVRGRFELGSIPYYPATGVNVHIVQSPQEQEAQDDDSSAGKYKIPSVKIQKYQ